MGVDKTSFFCYNFLLWYFKNLEHTSFYLRSLRYSLVRSKLNGRNAKPTRLKSQGDHHDDHDQDHDPVRFRTAEQGEGYRARHHREAPDGRVGLGRDDHERRSSGAGGDRDQRQDRQARHRRPPRGPGLQAGAEEEGREEARSPQRDGAGVRRGRREEGNDRDRDPRDPRGGSGPQASARRRDEARGGGHDHLDRRHRPRGRGRDHRHHLEPAADAAVRGAAQLRAPQERQGLRRSDLRRPGR